MNIWIDDGARHERAESGYGQMAAALGRELPRFGHRVAFDPYSKPDLRLYICPPFSMRFTGPDLPTVGFTMHELETLPESKADWPEILNRLDMVITPTSWNKRVWENLGVVSPIKVVPLGVDADVYYPATGRRCTFLSVHENLGSPSSRENWKDTLWAYCSAFRHSDDVLLRVKTWRWRRQEWEAGISEVAADLALDPERDLPPLEVVDDNLSGDEMRALYQDAWLFIKNANREGWGLPASEAAACGTRVAAAAIQPLLSHLPNDTIWFEGGDALELRYLLRSEYRRFITVRDKVRQRFTWAKSAKILSDFLVEQFPSA